MPYLLLAALTQLEPWSSNRHPTDAPKTHVQEVTRARQAYVVVQGGTMDGTNCRSPQGTYQPFEQTWESNRSVRIENVGSTDVVNPWLSNGRNDFRTTDELIARAVAPGMSDRDKARALWWQQIQARYHWHGDNEELGEPVKIFNVYGHNTCGNDSVALAGLWKRAGLKVAPARLTGHCVTQVFYEDRWHVMDGDMHSIYLLRDNETVAGEQDIVRDKDLVRRTHTQGLLHPDRAANEWESSLYVFEGEVTGDRNCRGEATMNLTLRPGEALTCRWGRLNPVKVHGANPPRFPDRVCNGLWEYRPDFSGETWRAGAAKVGADGVIVWNFRSPYVFVGGRLETEGDGATFSISWDGKAWEKIGADFDEKFPPDGPARYAYQLKCELPGGARLKKLAVINDLQMAPLALPGMIVGENSFTYTDQSPGERAVRITHSWVERSASKPPEAPPAPVTPPDGGEAAGTDVVFEWTPPAGAMADYHFELSDRPDLRWPLSMSFAKLISRTADAGKARYTLPEPGLLNPDKPYYWRVRAKNAAGVWGPWSRIWSFTPRGPATPADVALQDGVLTWKAGAARYRIYASDEKGFTASDVPLPVTVGVSKDVTSPFPANFVAEVDAPRTTVDMKRAFYRVVAVDAAGKRSGASDYVAAPRPLFTSKPMVAAKVGEAYRYAASSNRSLGDLRMRLVDGRQTVSYWDVEKPRYAIVKGPKWLSIDAATGVLSGTPDAAGAAEVELSVVLRRERRALDEATLKWGNEKVVASGTEELGPATQRFAIDVR